MSKKLLGFRNMQEKLEKCYLATGNKHCTVVKIEQNKYFVVSLLDKKMFNEFASFSLVI
jgi:flavin reductase (DIM6/NTAB) family NADH-FMN oxidoreductase RutF